MIAKTILNLLILTISLNTMAQTNTFKMTESEMKKVIKNEFKFFNKQDFVEMRKLFSDDFKSYNFPKGDSINVANPDDLMNRYITLFKENPNCHVELLEITFVGNKVFAKQKITGIKEPKIAMSIFQIENFKITKKWQIL